MDPLRSDIQAPVTKGIFNTLIFLQAVASMIHVMYMHHLNIDKWKTEQSDPDNTLYTLSIASPWDFFFICV